MFFFFFSSRRRHTRLVGDWSSDVCSSDLVGAPDDARTEELTLAARRAYRPRKVLTRLMPGGDATGLPAPLRAMLDGRSPRAYVCAGSACAAPTDDPSELTTTLTTFGRAGA